MQLLWGAQCPRILPTIIAIDKNTTPSQIRDAVKRHHQVTISYNAAKKSKKHLLGDDLEVQVARSNVATVGILGNYHGRKCHLKNNSWCGAAKGMVTPHIALCSLFIPSLLPPAAWSGLPIGW